MIGIFAFVVLVVGFLFACGALFASYKSEGEGSMGYGFLALLVFIITISASYQMMEHFFR